MKVPIMRGSPAGLARRAPPEDPLSALLEQ